MQFLSKYCITFLEFQLACCQVIRNLTNNRFEVDVLTGRSHFRIVQVDFKLFMVNLLENGTKPVEIGCMYI